MLTNHEKRELPSGKRSHVTMENSTMLLMGKAAISMATFNSELSNYQWVYVD